jgi:hypothetical protein
VYASPAIERDIPSELNPASMDEDKMALHLE